MLNSTKIKIGISPIGWTNDDMPELGGEIPFEQCIREMHETGYNGCEVGSKFPRDPETLLQLLKPYNLQIASQWFSTFFTGESNLGQTTLAFINHLMFLKSLGAKVIVVSEQGHSIQGQMYTPLFENKPELKESEWESLKSGLESIGKIASAHGMKIAYHHHMGTVVQSREEVDKLMQLTDPKYVHLLADTGHIHYAGGDPKKLVEDYIDRIIHVHLKDVRSEIVEKVRNEKLSFLQGVKLGAFTVPGDGVIDFKPIFETIGKSDYSGWLIVEAEQDPQIANPKEYAQKGRNTIRELAGI